MWVPQAGGQGNEPPIFFGLRPKKTGRSRSKRKALSVQILPIRAGLDMDRGRARRCPCNGMVSYRVRLGLGEQRWCFSAFGDMGAAFGVVDVWPLFLFPRSPLRLALPGGSRSDSGKRRWSSRSCTQTSQFPVAGYTPASFSKTEPAPNADASHLRVGNPKGRGRSPFPLSR